MLSEDVDRYIALRRALGYKLEKPERHLQSFAHFAAERGEVHIRTETAQAWATATSSTLDSRRIRWGDVILFARFLHAEDDRHEVPPREIFGQRIRIRPMPYIYTADEIARILDAAGELRRQRPNPLRREIYVTLFGLLAATGLRISEALALRLDDVRDGVLHVRETKLSKSRLVPMHPTAVTALDRYLVARRRLAGACDYFFPSVHHRMIAHSVANYTFGRLLQRANIAPERSRRPRIHDLRHTFATRVLEQCTTERRAVSRSFVALSTYLGHVDVRATYWYLEATPELMTDIAAAAEALVGSAPA